jgi:PGF-CTERM protein
VEWDCLPTGEPASRSFANFGLVLYDFGPYSNTATLFEQAREEGGVEAMNALYENPPESTEQFLHPDEYPDDEPVDVSYEDRSGDAWEMQTFEDGVDYATFGEAGIFTMLYYPSYDTRSTVAIDLNHIFDGSQGNTYVRLDFVHPASTGWDGDKLFVYTNASSAETNETGYVWKTVWESPDEAAEFADAYTTVLREYGDAVADRQDTYRVSDGSPFEDAFYVEVSGDTVTIVNAPTVGALAEVRRGAAPRAETTTETTTDDGETTTDDTETATTTATSTAGGDGTDDGDGQAQPDFGVGLAVVALLAAVFLLRRRD